MPVPLKGVGSGEGIEPPDLWGFAPVRVYLGCLRVLAEASSVLRRFCQDLEEKLVHVAPVCA